MEEQEQVALDGIAIIGMSGRFPGAQDLAQFWQNLRDGVESISRFSREELETAGIPPAVYGHPQFVNAGGVLDGIELFDASFFGFNPREAEVLDPQQRLFMECAWQALEDAGYDPERYPGAIGVYAGAAMSSYLFNIIANHDVMALVGSYQVLLGNDKDHVTTHVSYKLNLKGPSVAVQTACSTSLVAVAMACQSLLDHQCDMALAGGVSIKVPQKAGYVYQEGMINSPDGHCRAFDARAKGTVGGSGLGIVVLKRFADAMADGDHVYAVIKGSAINNDGSLKVGYTAPSVEGQAEVIAMAQAMAEVDAETIGYVEAHGTATPLGDPIEVAALTQAFRSSTNKNGFCAIGSVKSNIGHLDPAAGIAGLIKAVLMLDHRLLPPSLHFSQPNPQIDFADSPFYVNARLSEWKNGSTPRRAGVSSFGIGGTNAHIVLEEAPRREPPASSRPAQLILLSAKTSTALEAATRNFVEYVKEKPDLNVADVAYTYQVGRRAFSHRRMLVCHGLDDAAQALQELAPQRVSTVAQAADPPHVAFMFSGQGAQTVNMARELFETEPTFREHIEHCASLLQPHLGSNLLDILYPCAEATATAIEQLEQTWITQPALFTVEYALARLWMEWGVHPTAMVGHSIGEYVAACLAGVFSLEDALSLVAARGRLMQEMPPGSMLAIPLAQAEVESLLGQELDLAVVNGPVQCVASGPTEAIAQLEARLGDSSVPCRRLHTSHAFHSRMMEPVLAAFAEEVSRVNLKPPRLRYLSNVTGTWITPAMPVDPDYWATHLRQTVRFADGVRELLKDPAALLLEVGPGTTLASLAKQHPARTPAHVVLSSLPHPGEQQADTAFLLHTLGRLWLAGQDVDWSGFYAHEPRRRVPLPTYPFERRRYWIEPRHQAQAVKTRQAADGPLRDSAGWFYTPAWQQSPAPASVAGNGSSPQKLCWLVFSDAQGLGADLVERLQRHGHAVFTVTAGEHFARRSAHEYAVDPRRPADYDALLKELRSLSHVPQRVVHLWSMTAAAAKEAGAGSFDAAQDVGFYSLLYLAQALGRQNITTPVMMGVVADSIYAVTGDETLHPQQATLLGLCKVIPQEHPNIRCQPIDVATPRAGSQAGEKLLDSLIAEVTGQASETMVAYRGDQRWVQIFNAVRLNQSTDKLALLRQGGVYLITGGLGNIGMALAEDLAKTVRARLVLTGRSAFPSKEEWPQFLRTRGPMDTVSRKIHRLQAIERQGAEVMVVSADVADEGQLHRALDQVQARFGALHGVIHGAGTTSADAFAYVAQTDRKLCERHFRPKVYGLMALERALRGQKLDFWLLLSSLSAVLGGLGFAAYAAANSYMDAVASERNQTGSTPWISINWDGWDFRSAATGAGSRSDTAMSPKEGIEAYRRIMAAGTPRQVVVSVGDLQARIEKWIKLEIKSKAGRETEPAQREDKGELHARPDLPTEYVAPRNEVEQTIAAIWQELLGVEPVGIHDNFFEMGGHSLLAIQVVSRLRDLLQADISVHNLFETPTVAQLAEGLQAGAQPESDEAQKIAELLQLVEQLSDSEVQELLAKQLDAGGTQDE